MTEITTPDFRKIEKDLEEAKKEIIKIQTNELVHIQQEIDGLKKTILKLKPRTTSFYLGILFIIFIIGISIICLPLQYAYGITIVGILPLLMCLYAIYRIRKE